METAPSIDFEKKKSEFRSYYDENYEFLQSSAEVFRTLISALLVDRIPIDSVTCRIKKREECISKFKRKYLDAIEQSGTDYHIKDHITDIVGIRVVALYLEDIKFIQDLIEENFKEIDITDKISMLDSTEDKFGYKGLHLDLTLNAARESLAEYSKFKEVKFELQIRTIIQDAWSVLDHKIKYKKSIPTELKRRINRLSALFEVADEEFLRIKGETEEEKEKAKAAFQNKSEHLEEVITVFKFLAVAQQYFPSYRFIEYKADGFVSELLKIDNRFSSQRLISALDVNLKSIEKYSSDSDRQMNPYTMIRHCIYLLDKHKYAQLLYYSQRYSINRWPAK